MIVKDIVRYALRVPPVHAIANIALRAAVLNPPMRKRVNKLYLSLSYKERARFHSLFSTIFKGTNPKGDDAVWEVRFRDKTILMPLEIDQIWLDWNTAVSILGHDIDVKQTYDALLRSPDHRPDMFIDIGGNYGTHSLLFLSQGVKTMTFEPNEACHSTFLRDCKLNKVEPDLKAAALGDRRDKVELVFPEKDTWLGSVNTDVIQTISDEEGLHRVMVDLVMLDDFLPEMSNGRILIKIDAEGNEIPVLKGGEKTISEKRPQIIFESWRTKERADMYDLLSGWNYSLCVLPWNPAEGFAALSAEAFLESDESNFIAAPSETIQAAQQ